MLSGADECFLPASGASPEWETETAGIPLSPCRITVDLSALQGNFLALCADLRTRGESPRPICVVKADAYGHGAAACAAALAAVGADFFAVATLGEALSLRRTVPGADILLLSPAPRGAAPLLLRERISATVGSAADVLAITRALPAPPRAGAARSRPPYAGIPAGRVACHIKLDSGMHRLGFPITGGERAALDTCRALVRQEGWYPYGLYSHLAAADDPASPLTGEQVACFSRAAAEFRRAGLCRFSHLAASAGVLRFGSMGMDGVRFGIALYGIPPAPTLPFPPALAPRMRAVMRMESTLTRVFLLPRGACAGYGGAYRARRDTRVGVAAVGYADGLPRAATGAMLGVGGGNARIIGKVCMDACLLRLGTLSAAPGDPVTVWDESGRRLSALAARARTIPYELLCRASRRAERRYIFDQE